MYNKILFLLFIFLLLLFTFEIDVKYATINFNTQYFYINTMFTGNNVEICYMNWFFVCFAKQKKLSSLHSGFFLFLINKCIYILLSVLHLSYISSNLFAIKERFIK